MGGIEQLRIGRARNLLFLVMSLERKYSDYYEQLQDDVKKRYNDKLSSIGEGVDDPYTFSSGLGITDDMPNIEYPDIYNFLLIPLALILKTNSKHTRVWMAISIYWLVG